MVGHLLCGPRTNGDHMSTFQLLRIFIATLQATSSEKDEKTTCMGVFNACVAVVNQNINVAEFLLPYLMVESLKREKFAADYIISEVLDPHLQRHYHLFVDLIDKRGPHRF